MRLRISARKSDLARLQAYQVGHALIEKHPTLEISYSFRESLGDKNLTDPLWKMPEKGVFTEDFVQDLLDQKTDMVVHSWKDLPVSLRPGTHIAATLPRADQRDMVLFKKSSEDRVQRTRSLKVFSSSPRRAYNLEKFFKQAMPWQPQAVEFVNVRGNIQTRVRKLMDDPEVDALVLAKAALDRLLSANQPEFTETKNFLRECLQSLRWMVLPLSVNPNAAAQGALAIEVKDGRCEILELLKSIQCQQTFDCVSEERKVLSSFGGGCHQKIGVAVLERPYGPVFFLKGLTDAGEVLSYGAVVRDNKFLKLTLKTPHPKKFPVQELMSSRELSATREPIEAIQWPKDISALWISKEEALPKEFKFEGPVWCAGVITWYKLASRGVWVNGTAEGLGEDEEPRLEALLGENITWTKLTHQDAVASQPQSVATYKVSIEAQASQFENKQAFFWHSGSQFLAALMAVPGLKSKFHACGPGTTAKVLQKHLGPQARVDIFLNEEEWRTTCSL